jgi:hypothetical protein
MGKISCASCAPIRLAHNGLMRTILDTGREGARELQPRMASGIAAHQAAGVGFEPTSAG